LREAGADGTADAPAFRRPSQVPAKKAPTMMTDRMTEASGFFMAERSSFSKLQQTLFLYQPDS
jgi:hypothetical protein